MNKRISQLVELNSLKLILVTDLDNKLISDNIDDYLQKIAVFAAHGVTSVQLRSKSLHYQDLCLLGNRLQKILKPLKVPLIVNDNIDLCTAIDADGLHLGQSDLNISNARSVTGDRKIIGLSVSSLQEAEVARSLPIDYIGVGSVFPTYSKSDAKLIGLEALRSIAAISLHPVVAIGGITTANIDQVIANGATGLACIKEFSDAYRESMRIGSDDPIARTVKALRNHL